MDGGGRYLRPLRAGYSGRAGVAASSPSGVLTKLQRRLPRLFGTGLTLALFALIGATGLVLGGHVQAFREHHGEPRHALARARRMGVEQATFRGSSQIGEKGGLTAGSLEVRGSRAFLAVGDVRERL